MARRKISCRSCTRSIIFDEKHLGRIVKCPDCNERVKLGKRPASTEQQSSSAARKQKSPTKPVASARPQKQESASEDFDLDWLSSPVSSESYSTADEADLPPARRKKVKKRKGTDERLPAATRQSVSAKKKSSPVAQSGTANGSRWLIYGLFFATLIPLATNILLSQDDIEARLAETLTELANDENAFAAIDAADDDEAFFNALPDHRIRGAYLAHDSWMHWTYAGFSAAGFLGLMILLFRKVTQSLSGAIASAVFTATLGIILLLCLQWAAFASQGVWIRGRGILVLLFYVVKFVGFSYSCALQEGNGFILSFFGFTMGVGICEEVCKIIPVIVYIGTAKNATWQDVSFVGLASGVGFGVSEGITYSSDYYNGISGGEIYFVRFVSCVALHAVWSGAGAVLLFGQQDAIHSNDYSDLAGSLAMTLGVPIILHGLYDTLLKQDYPVGALVVGVLSVAWLIGTVEILTQREQAQWA